MANYVFLILATLVSFQSVSGQESAQPSSTGWGSSGTSDSTQAQLSQSSGEVLPVEFVIQLKGKAVEGEDRITLEGEGRVENTRLNLYFKKQQRESQQSSYSYGNSSSGNGNSSTSSYGSLSGSSASGTSGTGQSTQSLDWGGGAMAGIAAAHFKLLALEPYASTGKVTAELYMGEDDFSPYLEALDVRLNPFKKTPMEIVLSSFEQVALRKVRVVVHLDGPVKEAWKEQEFKADFRCYLQVGDSYGNSSYGSGSLDDAEIQWVDDSSSESDSSASGF